MEKKEIRIKSPLPFYIAGGCFALYSLIFPMYRWGDLLMALALSAAAFFAAERLCPVKTEWVEVPKKVVLTGNAQLDAVIREGNAALARIRALNDAIPDTVLSEKISRMETLGGQIFERIRSRPEKAGQLRRFMDYYLPTTLKMLSSYRDLQDKQDIRGEHIQKTLSSIKEAADMIVQAFEKQLDNLYADEALDISTDADVLEGMLTKEGLINRVSDPDQK